MSQKSTIADITHPYYDEKQRDWLKWRYTYEGGQRFIDQYLVQFSIRETEPMFAKRKSIAYNPAFAKQAIDEVKNSIFQRLVDIVRKDGSSNFTNAVDGNNGGIDMLGSSMTSFIGTKILPELLTMSRVGVFVDMPQLSGLSVYDAQGKRPYVYIYRAEDIRSWTLDETNNESEFTNILLRDYVYLYDDKTGLPAGLVARFRRMWIEDEHVRVQFYNAIGEKTDVSGTNDINAVIDLDIPRIPFIITKLSDSLLTDVANYQIALLNLASSDLSYTLNANFPFYTEQIDPRSEMSQYIRRAGQDGDAGEAADAISAKTEEVKIGNSTGRRYPLGTDRPGFIHPSSEPLKAAMEKEEQLKREIRQLVALAVSNLAPQKQASADSKAYDQQGLEAGLSYIGLELEMMERKIASYWAMYEKSQPAAIFYPENYVLKTEDEKRAEITGLVSILNTVPSTTYRKSICKQIAQLALGRKVSTTELEKVMKEIEQAKANTSDPDVIIQMVTAGVCDIGLAADLCGYPAGTADKAASDHAERLARIAETQTKNNGLVNGGARGIPEQDQNSGGGGKQEKQGAKDTTKDPVPKDKVRGKG